jgi:hypothetical protein
VIGRYIKIAFFLCAYPFLTLVGQQVVSFHKNGFQNIGRFDRLELGIELTPEATLSIENFLTGGQGINPYDYEQIKLTATFFHKKGEYKREGFYFRNILIDTMSNTFAPARSRFPFRVRFAPPETGGYSFKLELIAKDSLIFSYNGTLQVVESGKRGFLSVGNYRHLKDYDGNSFFAVGQSIAFAEDPCCPPIEPSNFITHRKWISDLADNKGNFFRMRLDPWSYELEQEELGVFGSKRKPSENFERQFHAYELDETFRLAEDRGLYIFLTMLGDYAFSSTEWFGWKINPYNTVETSNTDFFDVNNGHSIDQYKKKLRYFMARYGYSANLGVISLINETDHIEGYEKTKAVRANVNVWLKTIAAYLKSDAFYPSHLLTNGYGSSPQRPDVGIDNSILFDILSTNHYSTSRRSIKQRHDDMPQRVFFQPETKKPFIYGELGAGLCVGQSNSLPDWFSDADFHNTIWSTAMYSQAFGNGLYWWDWEQESHLDPKDPSRSGLNHRQNFRALSQFFTESPPNFEMEDFTSDWDSDLEALNELGKRKIEWIANVNKDGTKGFGWVHNSDYFWINDPLALTSENCSNCVYGGLNAFYDSDCYNEKNSAVNAFNEPKGPYGFAQKHEEISLKGFKAFRKYTLEIWSCYGDGGLFTTIEIRANSLGRLNFRRNLGTYPGDGYGDPDFAYKVHLTNELFDEKTIVYPNPFQDSFIIESGEAITGLSICNSAGNEIKRETINTTKKMECNIMDGEPPGVYILKVFLNYNYHITFKIIKL